MPDPAVPGTSTGQTFSTAFIGLGVMGYPMAGHLAANGHQVTVYNRTASRADDWCSQHGANGRTKSAKSPADAAEGADIVFMCVGNDHDVRDVALGEQGVLAGMRKTTRHSSGQSAALVFVDHTTASADIARVLHGACSEHGIGFLDAPVSGGQAGAESGQLTIMVGGDQPVFDQAAPVMACYARMCRLLGPAGAGQLAKMVNQICIAGVLQGLSEGVAFAEQAGLDVGEVIEVISKGAAQSWQMENRAATMAQDKFDFGFAVNWMRKDLDIALTTGRKIDARLPLTALVDQFYADVQLMGGGRWDTSSLVRRLRGGAKEA